MKINREPWFAKNTLDRMDHLRGSIDLFLDSLTHPQVYFILVCGDMLITHENKINYLFSRDEINRLSIISESKVFLGQCDAIYYFALTIDYTLLHQVNAVDFRSFVTSNFNTEENLGILAQAFGALKWLESHQFCPSCGAKNQINNAGWRLDCTQCSKQHFPRTDPVVIMLVTYGEYCLLGRGLHFSENRYSCLAGFMEPGETIEDAARRELFEEAGVVGLDVEYIASQPWPFPFSLMIGVHVHAKEMVLKINHEELLDAKWVSKAEIVAVLQDSIEHGFSLPPPIAIAWTLLSYWISS